MPPPPIATPQLPPALQLPDSSLSLHSVLSIDTSRRRNLHFIDDANIVSAVGNVVVLLNLKSGEQRSVRPPRDGAVGAIAVHPRRTFLALAEVCPTHIGRPNIYIYSLPDLALIRTLPDGAERGYADLAFNEDGTKLASVGLDPDYMLTVWNWDEQVVILKSKAFSQDVLRVSFHPTDSGQLVTSGMGHIKFWTMASTFTGLKLQGEVGKFGATELSDIYAFLQLPDGKVLSSSEWGNLLLWEGGVIKCEITQTAGKRCHSGRVEVVMAGGEGEVLTAGEDGVVRIWDFETIDGAEGEPQAAAPISGDGVAGMDDSAKLDVGSGTKLATGETGSGPAGSTPTTPSGASTTTTSTTSSKVFALHPADEIPLGPNVRPVDIVPVPSTPDEYLVLDRMGALHRLNVKKRTCVIVVTAHAGAVVGAASSAVGHVVASVGAGGTVRVDHVRRKAVVARGRWPVAGSAVAYLPKSLDPLGTTIALGFADGTLRFVNHANPQGPPSSTDTQGDSPFKLTHVLKPHSTRIVAVCIAPHGRFLATAGEDCTVFFFQVLPAGKRGSASERRVESLSGERSGLPRAEIDAQLGWSRDKVQIKPVGFVKLPSAVASMGWSPDNHVRIDAVETEVAEGGRDNERLSRDLCVPSTKGRLLMVLRGGQVMHALVPSAREVDSGISFQLDAKQCPVVGWRLGDPAPELTAKRRKLREEEERKLEEASQNGVAREEGERGTEESKELGGKNDQDADKGAQNPPSKVEPRDTYEDLDLLDAVPTYVYYLEGGYFLLALKTLTGKGEIRTCKYSEPNHSRIIMSGDAPFSVINVSPSGNYLLAGTVDGTTYIQTFHVAQVTLQGWVNSHETLSEHLIRMNNVQSSASPGQLKIETGMRWMTHAHDHIRGQLTAVAPTFDDAFVITSATDGGLLAWASTMEEPIQAENSAVNENISVDSSVTVGVEDITDSKAYSLEEAKLKSEKDRELSGAETNKQVTRAYIADLRNEFKKLVEENEKAPADCQLPKSVFSVDAGLKEDIESWTERKRESLKKELQWPSAKESLGLEKLRKKFLDNIDTERLEVGAFRLSDGKSRHLTTTKPAEGNTKDVTMKQKRFVDQKTKLEARKQERAERAAQWKDLLESKPDENYQDPRDLGAIRQAERNMGDYKLKSAADYIVPESDRVDVEKKKRQVLLLIEAMHRLQEVFELRGRKVSLVDFISSQTSLALRLNAELTLLGEAVHDEVWEPTMDTSAFPERRFDVSKKDIGTFLETTKHALLNRRTGEDGLAGFGIGSSGSSPGNLSSPADVLPVADMILNAPSPKLIEQPNPVDGREGRPSTVSRGPAQMLEDNIRRKTLAFRKNQIQKDIAAKIDEFDEMVKILMRERIALQGDIKFAQLRMVVLYREWLLLKEFEKFDHALEEKLLVKATEKDDITAKLCDMQTKLSIKKAEVEDVTARLKNIHEEFKSTLGDNNKFEDILSKTFKRKIKRSKKRGKVGANSQQGQGSKENEEEEQMSSESDSDFESDLDDDEGSESEGPEYCPTDCDPAVYASVLELRERKLDVEDILNDIQRAAEATKKEHDAIVKKERSILVAFQTVEEEIQAFQTQKQQKLNEIRVVVPLRPHQLLHLDTVTNTMYEDLSEAIVFSNIGLQQLRCRIGDLQREKADVKKQHRELKGSHVTFVKSRKEKEANLQALSTRLIDAQMLKFGRQVDLEKLERLGVNKTADELRDKMEREEKERFAAMTAMEVRLGEWKDELTNVVKENTARLERLLRLKEQQSRLEDALGSSQSNVTNNYSGPNGPTSRSGDIAQLHNVTAAQAKQIEALKGEIAHLNSKPMRGSSHSNFTSGSSAKSGKALPHRLPLPEISSTKKQPGNARFEGFHSDSLQFLAGSGLKLPSRPQAPNVLGLESSDGFRSAEYFVDGNQDTREGLIQTKADINVDGKHSSDKPTSEMKIESSVSATQ
ncbi:Cilia- and flagella-associated protein 44 [Gonapodya sp. JEL0774]|nr:Cilia- and flagella-associated protein 44 [Gonapodya sp. JEL0774]